MKKVILINLIIVAMLGCLAQSCSDNSSSPNRIKGYIAYDNLQVGQVSRYVYFVGENRWDTANLIQTYYRDTLVIEVVANNNNVFTFKEYLAKGSEVFNGGVGPDECDSTYYYTVRIKGDSIFYDFGEYTYPKSFLHLKAVPFSLNVSIKSDSKALIKSWITCFETYGSLDGYGYSDNVQILNNYYDYIGVHIDDSFTVVDGPGYYFLYTKSNGMIRNCMLNLKRAMGYGWDLI